MRALTVTLFLSALAVPGAAEEWTPVVLMATEVQDDGEGSLVIHLSSGQTITVATEDWSESWSSAVAEAIANQEKEAVARSEADPPSDADAAAMIRSKCAREWSDDFAMRKYCEDQQYEALRKLRAHSMTGQLVMIRSKCAREWPDDFAMRNYCEEQQLEALRQLNR